MLRPPLHTADNMSFPTRVMARHAALFKYVLPVQPSLFSVLFVSKVKLSSSDSSPGPVPSAGGHPFLCVIL